MLEQWLETDNKLQNGVMKKKKVEILCVQDTKWKGNSVQHLRTGDKLFYFIKTASFNTLKKVALAQLRKCLISVNVYFNRKKFCKHWQTKWRHIRAFILYRIHSLQRFFKRKKFQIKYFPRPGICSVETRRSQNPLFYIFLLGSEKKNYLPFRSAGEILSLGLRSGRRP